MVTLDNYGLDHDIGHDVESIIQTTAFNTKVLNNRNSKLVNPIITDNIVEIPRSRCLYLNILNDIPETVETSLEILNNIEYMKAYVYTPTALINPVGKLIRKKKSITTTEAMIRKVVRNGRVIQSTETITLGAMDVLVMNYKEIHNQYTYQNSKSRVYDATYNSLYTAVYHINQSVDIEHNVMVFNIPKDIPSVTTLIKETKREVGSDTYNKFTTKDSILMMELWKLFYPDSESVFKQIKEDKLASTYIMFQNESRYTIYRLLDLLALAKSNELESTVSAKDNNSAAKLFMYSLLTFIINTTPTLSGDLPTSGVTDDDGTIDPNRLSDMLTIVGANDKPDDITGDDVGLSGEDDIAKLTNEVDDEDDLSDVDDATIADVIVKGRRPDSKNSDTFRVPTDNPEVAKLNILQRINQANSKKTISANDSLKLADIVDTIDDRVLPMGNGKSAKLGDILKYEETTPLIHTKATKDSPTTLNKKLLVSTNTELDSQYLAELYHKDVYNAIYSIQEADVVITNHTIEDRKTYLGESEVHTLEVKPLDGVASKVKLILPKIDPIKGTYQMSSNEYLLRNQRMDLPIRKTSSTTVLLSSYQGKLFIEKNIYQRNNPSIYLSKLLANDDRFSSIVLKGSTTYDMALPKSYTNFSNSISRFTYRATAKDNPYMFIFDHSYRLGEYKNDIEKQVLDIEKKHNVISIGYRNHDTIAGTLYMDHDGLLYSADSKSQITVGGDVEGFFRLNTTDMPLEVAYIKVMNRVLPLGVLLLYYLGMTKLLQKAKVKKSFHPNNDKIKPNRDEYAIKLSDGVLIFKKTDRVATLLLSGLPTLLLSTLTLAELDSKAKLSTMLNILELSIAHSNAIDSIETLFLDSITKDTLKQMNEPTNIHDLLIRATELLVDDNYTLTNKMEGYRVVRYERVAGLIYKSLSKAMKSYKNRNTLSKAKIALDPYEVWKAIGDDSTSMLVENNNPIASIKQRDSITYLGEFGRAKITMTIPTRAMTEDAIGIISESSPDSGDAGVTTYLSHNASITNLRGMVNVNDSIDSLDDVLSTPNIVNPFIDMDESKRMNFASVQSSHIIPMNKMKSGRIWTGAEGIIASKVGEPFVKIAEAHGVVTKLTKSAITVAYRFPTVPITITTTPISNSILSELESAMRKKGYIPTVVVNNEKKPMLSLSIYDGKVLHPLKSVRDVNTLMNNLKAVKLKEETKSYSIQPWSSKVEGGTSIKHTMGTFLIVGDRVEPGMAIVYDSGFFEPNIYDKKSIILKMGSYYTVALLERRQTYEDSIMVSGKMLEATGEDKYNVMSKLLSTESHITNVIPEGTHVNYGDKLMTILDSSLVADTELSDRAREILSEANDSSPKTVSSGVIDRIDVLYNCELSDMDASIRELAITSNARFKKEQGVDGRVTSEYSVRGKSLQPGEIELKYYINHNSKSKIGDKFIIGHQLKNTMGAIVDDIKTERGEPIDLIGSNKSVLARITLSSYVYGTTARLMRYFTDKAISQYKK